MDITGTVKEEFCTYLEFAELTTGGSEARQDVENAVRFRSGITKSSGRETENRVALQRKN
ncbi:hypothetical protein F511_47171 [Dorcoceras hygrometricum]|uniref:Uncharacterized protein n=1 Tax=Dorcoceras hygrometricum TaxID=472368 RepID=A0A2Z6ZRQ8_9LAMI|nr:hypothetical protein F511_47171 [Dorcoceras hygrometricum]